MITEEKLNKDRELLQALAADQDQDDGQVVLALAYVGDCIRQNSKTTRDCAEALARVLKT